MSELTAFEDLALLSTQDLRDVLHRASRFELALALAGQPYKVQQRFLDALTDGSRDMVAASIGRLGRIADDVTATARDRLIDLALRMGRSGRITFDAPEDLVA